MFVVLDLFIMTTFGLIAIGLNGGKKSKKPLFCIFVIASICSIDFIIRRIYELFQDHTHPDIIVIFTMFATCLIPAICLGVIYRCYLISKKHK